MRNIFLSLVMVAVLIAAGVGGTLASFSDTEASLDNVFEVGNMDLKVDDIDDTGGGLDQLIEGKLMWPCDSKDFTANLHNLGDNTETSYVYMGFKNFDCYEVYTAKFLEADRPEPEIVAENGGWLANKQTPAMGPWGQDCTLPMFIEVLVEYEDDEGGMDTVLGNGNWGGPGTVYLSELWSGVTDDILWIYLGELPGCNDRNVKVSLHISNWSEEQWMSRASAVGSNFHPSVMPQVFSQNGTGADLYPFNDWLTNLFMNDGVNFEVIFGLTSEQIGSNFVK